MPRRPVKRRMPTGGSRGKPSALFVFPPDVLECEEKVRELLGWFSGAGLTEQVCRVKTAAWPETWDGEPHGPQRIPQLKAAADELLGMLEADDPDVLVLVSSNAWQAFYEIESEAEAPLWRPAVGRSRRLLDHRLGTVLQRREHALLLGVPVPCRQTNNAFLDELGKALRGCFERSAQPSSPTSRARS